MVDFGHRRAMRQAGVRQAGLGNEAKRWACETKFLGDFALEGAKSAVHNHLFVSALSIGKSRSRRNDAGFHGGRGVFGRLGFYILMLESQTPKMI